MAERTCIAIDLKSFYASVECIERNLDPLTTHLVVADVSRTEKTICLAVSPALKAYGIPGRPRLFEVLQKVREVNAVRRRNAPGHRFSGESHDSRILQSAPEQALGLITATPRMALYIEYSTRIYDIYLNHVAPEDIHVYSIDEVFIDVTNYLRTRRQTARELAISMIRDVFRATGITATAGIGTNLYLAKIAMDIVAKKMPADQNGVRIAELDESSYRHQLWEHRPLTDFWRVGKGYASRLERCGLMTMGDIARCSTRNENLLYKLFGVNAELLIDHAWGWEPCTIADIKAYRPASSSLGSGQVLPCAYAFDKARLAVREMIDLLALNLVDKRLATDQLVLSVGYDSLSNPEHVYDGEIITDAYGRKIPKHAQGTANLGQHTASEKLLTKATMELFDRITDKRLLVHKLQLTACHVQDEASLRHASPPQQLTLFTDYAAQQEAHIREKAELKKERQRQEVILTIRKRYGKNAILKGMDLREGATTRERNDMIGGHKA